MSTRAKWAREEGYEPRYVRLPQETLERLQRDTARRFHDNMDMHMLINGYKYGDVALAYPDKVDALASLKKRLDTYEDTGNVELLEDIANFAMIEWMHPRHERAHYAHEADGSIGRVVPGVGEFTERSNAALVASPAEQHAQRGGD